MLQKNSNAATAMPESHQPSLISALPPSRAQKQMAFAAMVLLFALFLGVVPFGQVQLRQLDVFPPIVATTMFLCDSITATLLYAQFAVLRSRALLVLANGYLFTALVVIPYALTFPGSFATNGLLGAGPQTPGWIYICWHIGLPATIIAYTFLRQSSPEMRVARGSVGSAVGISILVVALLVLGLTLFVTIREDLLPVMVLNVTDLGGVASIVTASVLLLCIIAVVVLWFTQRSLLDLWLLVVSVAWLLDSILLNVMGHRFDVAWYATRVFGISSASFVLFVLLAESTMLYAKLALSVLAQNREREGRLMSMDAMSAAIAHEIKQPLGAMVANANAGQRWLAKAPPAYEDALESFKDIAADGHRASEVIQSVRAMFGKSEQTGAPLDTNELIRESVAIVHGELDAARIEVQLELAPQLPLITAHRGQLQQVILNIVTNAADAMRTVIDRTRVLRIESSTFEAKGVAVTVEDSGTGIEPKDVDKIFNPFFTTKSKGMGMGLAICRSIVEAHGGTLSVAPGMPHGSVFRIVLPGVL
jgi:signal transduction histidine kinase